MEEDENGQQKADRYKGGGATVQVEHLDKFKVRKNETS